MSVTYDGGRTRWPWYFFAAQAACTPVRPFSYASKNLSHRRENLFDTRVKSQFSPVGIEHTVALFPGVWIESLQHVLLHLRGRLAGCVEPIQSL